MSAKPRKRVSRRKLFSSARFWKQSPEGFNAKYGLTGDFLIPAHIKRPTKRTLTASKSTIDDWKQARGVKRSRALAKVQRSVESVEQRKASISERQQTKPKPANVKRLVPVVAADGSFQLVKMGGADLAKARDRAQAMRFARRNPKALAAYESSNPNPYTIAGQNFIGERDALSEAKTLMNKRQRKALDKAYAEMFVD